MSDTIASNMLFIDIFIGFSVAIETSLAKSLKVISDPIEPEIFEIIILVPSDETLVIFS